MLKSLEAGFKNALRPLLLPAALRALQTEAAAVKSPEDALDLAFRFRHRGIRFTPSQVREEITGFLKLLAARPPRTVLEIGTDKGGTFFLLARAARPDALVVSLDLPAGQGYAYSTWREPLYRSFAREQQRIELVREDSHAPGTVEKIRRVLDGRRLDVLFIDGDHSYEGVKQDFEMYSPLVAKGGLVAFHDIVDGVAVHVGGVPQYWRELKAAHPHQEFVKSWQQGGWGIGALPNFGQ
jgi:predicted O-methyltransferase YrrM